MCGVALDVLNDFRNLASRTKHLGDTGRFQTLDVGIRNDSTHDHENDPGLFYLSGKDLNIGKSRDGGTSWQKQAIPAPADMLFLCGFRGLRLQAPEPDVVGVAAREAGGAPSDRQFVGHVYCPKLTCPVACGLWCVRDP